ncbi:hypothetical protein [Streptomyces sp. NPDC057582]|uniref:hypothetical protein n=1 Tax=Streptomyces sp. NPDC057582 TaxID=3346174 RepID=UPI0036C4F296
MTRVPEWRALDTGEKAAAFGLLCAARLSAVASLGGLSCATELGAFVRGWGDGVDVQDRYGRVLAAYSRRFPVRDDVGSPDYYRSLAVDIALMAVHGGEKSPADHARRLMFMASGAWAELDALAARRTASARTTHDEVPAAREREVSCQASDASALAAASDVRDAYRQALARYRAEYAQRARYFQALVIQC